MDADQIAMTLMDAGQRAGGRPEAVSDYLRRGFDAFPLDAPIEQVSPWVEALKPVAPHLFSAPRSEGQAPASPIRPEHQYLSASERLTRCRQPAVKRQRPQPIELSAAEQASLGFQALSGVNLR